MDDFCWIFLSEREIEEKFDLLKEEVILDTGLDGLLTINSVEDLIKIIKAFKKIAKKDSEDNYFKSERHKLAFMILKHEGNTFDEELGIKKKHYIDKVIAKEWKQKYQSIFHPDNNINDDSIDYGEVMQRINKIFNRMVGKA